MAAITVDASAVHLPNETEVIKIRGTAGGAIAPGQPVYLDGNNGWKIADADVLAKSQARGICLSVPGGGSVCVTGDRIDIVTEGRITGYSGMTPGGDVFISTTDGSLDQTAPPSGGDYPFAIGWAESATTIYVHPQIVVPTVNP